jgi:hypothetical protein
MQKRQRDAGTSAAAKAILRSLVCIFKQAPRAFLERFLAVEPRRLASRATMRTLIRYHPP